MGFRNRWIGHTRRNYCSEANSGGGQQFWRPTVVAWDFELCKVDSLLMWRRGTTEGQTGEEGHDHSCSVSAEDPHYCCSVSAEDPHHCCVAIIGHCHVHMSMLVALCETQEAKHSRLSCFVYWLNKHSENFATGHGIKAIPASSAPIMTKSLECTQSAYDWYFDGKVGLHRWSRDLALHWGHRAWDGQTERLYSLVMMFSQRAVALARCMPNMVCWQVYVRPISDTWCSLCLSRPEYPSIFSHACERKGENTHLSTVDGGVVWDSTAYRWTLTWQWKDCRQRAWYLRTKLTPNLERLFAAEVVKWAEEEWLAHPPPLSCPMKMCNVWAIFWCHSQVKQRQSVKIRYASSGMPVIPMHCTSWISVKLTCRYQ